MGLCPRRRESEVGAALTTESLRHAANRDDGGTLGCGVGRSDGGGRDATSARRAVALARRPWRPWRRGRTGVVEGTVFPSYRARFAFVTGENGTLGESGGSGGSGGSAESGGSGGSGGSGAACKPSLAAVVCHGDAGSGGRLVWLSTEVRLLRLLVAECLHRVEPSGAARGVVAKDEADEHADARGDAHRVERDRRRDARGGPHRP